MTHDSVRERGLPTTARVVVFDGFHGVDTAWKVVDGIGDAVRVTTDVVADIAHIDGFILSSISRGRRVLVDVGSFHRG